MDPTTQGEWDMCHMSFVYSLVPLSFPSVIRSPNASEIRSSWPMVPIQANARDSKHARRLRELGATFCTPNTLEASLPLANAHW